jgi:hypothetical protein
MATEPRSTLERVAVLENQFADMSGDIREIKNSLEELVALGNQARGRSDANARILQGLPPALWMTFLTTLGAGMLWLWEHTFGKTSH